jgi:hypothetical protein
MGTLILLRRLDRPAYGLIDLTWGRVILVAVIFSDGARFCSHYPSGQRQLAGFARLFAPSHVCASANLWRQRGRSAFPMRT